MISILGTRKIIVSIYIIIILSGLIYGLSNYSNVFEKTTASEKIYKSCLISMKNKTCFIMLGPKSDLLGVADGQVLIAGVGQVDLKIYRSIRDNPQMCEDIKSACQENLNAPVCRLADSLYH